MKFSRRLLTHRLPSFVLLVCAAVIAGCTGKSESADAKVADAEAESAHRFLEMPLKMAQDAEVGLEKAGSQKINETVTLLGEISLNEDAVAHIHPRFAGTVKKVLKNQGDDVISGDLLAVIQSNDTLAPYEIKSETQGTIVAKTLSVGDFVKDDQEIFAVADLGKVWANASVYEENIGRVKVDMPVIVKSSSGPIEQEATISYINPILSKPTRSQPVRVFLDNKDGHWMPGQFLHVDVIVSQHDAACAAPSAAIVTIDDHPNVFVQGKDNDGKEGFEVRKVELGRSDGKFTEITSGISPGEVIAGENSFVLKAELEKGSPD